MPLIFPSVFIPPKKERAWEWHRPNEWGKGVEKKLGERWGKRSGKSGKVGKGSVSYCVGLKLGQDLVQLTDGASGVTPWGGILRELRSPSVALGFCKTTTTDNRTIDPCLVVSCGCNRKQKTSFRRSVGRAFKIPPQWGGILRAQPFSGWSTTDLWLHNRSLSGHAIGRTTAKLFFKDRLGS